VRRAVEENVLERFLACGDLHCGFARMRCAGCGHDLLLAFAPLSESSAGTREC